MALDLDKCFPITNSATFYKPGVDNTHGDKANGGRDTHTQRPYYSDQSVCATPWRNEIKRLREVLDGKVDPSRLAEGEVGLVIKNGKAVVALSQDVGGLEVPQYSDSIDKRGIPHSDIDLSPRLVSQLPGMKIVGKGLEGKDGISIYSLGAVYSHADMSKKTPEQIAKLKSDLSALEEIVAKNGRVPIYRPAEQQFGPGFDANGRRLSFTKQEANSFWARYDTVRNQIYPPPTISQLDKAQELIEKVNNNQANVSELKSVLGTVYNQEALQDTRLASLSLPKDVKLPTEISKGGAYAEHDPSAIPTREQVAARLTAGMEGQQPGESDTDYANRKRNYMSDLLNMMPSETRMILLVLAVIFNLIDPNGLGKTFLSIFEGAGQGYGNGYSNYNGRADASRYNGKGVLGGRVEGLDSVTAANGQKITLELPKYDPAINKTAGEYFAACAKKFEGLKELQGNRGDLVKWVMANAGLSEGDPWCAGFTSKMYEGTGLYNYTAAAINFAEQGMATKSYRGIEVINDIQIGDTVVYARDGGNHVGIVTDVKRDANGKVKVIASTEGNTGSGVVATHVRTPEQLQANRFLGYVSISHREQKLLEMGALKQPIAKTLEEKYSAGREIQIETTPPVSTKVPPPTASVTTPGKAGEFTVVIDRGHGAHYGSNFDPGAVSPTGLREIDISNKYQHYLKVELEAKGFRVALTSPTIDASKQNHFADKNASLYARTDIANQAIGNGKGMYVSIHANKITDDAAKTYQQKNSGAEIAYNGANSKELADILAGGLKNSGYKVNRTMNYGRGGERNDGKGLVQFENAKVPSVILETGYLDNKGDEEKLRDDNYLKAQAKATAESMDSYAKKYLGKTQELARKKEAVDEKGKPLVEGLEPLPEDLKSNPEKTTTSITIPTNSALTVAAKTVPFLADITPTTAPIVNWNALPPFMAAKAKTSPSLPLPTITDKPEETPKPTGAEAEKLAELAVQHKEQQEKSGAKSGATPKDGYAATKTPIDPAKTEAAVAVV